MGQDPHARHGGLEAQAVNQWLLNVDTVENVLEHPMRNGVNADNQL